MLEKSRNNGQRITKDEIEALKTLYMVHGKVSIVERLSSEVIDGGVHYNTINKYRKSQEWDKYRKPLETILSDKVIDKVVEEIAAPIKNSLEMLFAIRDKIFTNVLERLNKGELTGGINTLLKIIELEHVLTSDGSGADYADTKEKAIVTQYVNIYNTDGAEGIKKAIDADQRELDRIAERLQSIKGPDPG